MKLLIFEGPDNIGKSTTINNLKTYLSEVLQKNVKVIHFDMPKGKTNQERIEYIDKYNSNMCRELVDMQTITPNMYDYVILDRSWYSEYVYGIIYRNRNAHDIANKIYHIECKILEVFQTHEEPTDLNFILLNTPNVDILVNNEDGLSLSNGTADMKATIKREISLFDHIFKYSILPPMAKSIVNTTTMTSFKDNNDVVKEILAILKIE